MRVRLATLVAVNAGEQAGAGGAGVNELGAPGSGLASSVSQFFRRRARFAVVGALVAAAGAIGYGVGWRAGAGSVQALEPAPSVPGRATEQSHVALASANDERTAVVTRDDDSSDRAGDPSATDTHESTGSQSSAGVRAPHRATAPNRLPANGAAPVASTASTPPDDDSGQELRTLRRVEMLLRDRNAQYAAVLLRELDREIPHGRFMEERSAATTVAACELAPDARRTQAIAFSAKYPGSVYQKRVEASCASDDARIDGKARRTD